jgi:endonuclease/exonuclease/phosphatase family metal-dependent hydrolase
MNITTRDPNTEVLSLSTVNVHGLKSCMGLVCDLMKSNQILAIQEHWLHKFEVNDIKETLLTHGICSAFKCYDDEDPIPITNKPRGQAGVGLLWRQSIDHSVEVLPDGSHRILASMLATSTGPVCVIAAYMPTHEQHSVPEYEDKLMEINEICAKCSPADMILCGDMNGSLHRSLYKHDPILQEFVKNEGWKLPVSDYPDIATFYPNREGYKNSTIDYVLVKSHNMCDGIEAEVLDHPLNTSDHKPVRVTFTLEIAPKAMQEISLLPPGRPWWHKADISAYEEKVHDLAQSCVTMVTNSPFAVDLAAVNLISILRGAEKGTVPRPSQLVTPRKPHSPEWVAIHQELKEVHRAWCVEGKTEGHTLENLKHLKWGLRQCERHSAAARRDGLYRDIESASMGDCRLFYRLVNKQRRTAVGPTTTTLVYKEHTYKDHDILGGWSSYFGDLAKPEANPDFDSEFAAVVSQDMEVYTEMAALCTEHITPFTADEVSICIRKLNRNKAADKYGLTAEHLRFGELGIVPAMTDLFNSVVSTASIPTVFKEGVLSPLLKKAKLSRKLPTNYRGITIISILGKVLELLFLLRCGHILKRVQNPLQRGFTSEVAPIYAALILMEVVNEYKDKGDDLTVIMLDAEKAFNKVWHQGLFRRLALSGVPRDLLGLIQDWYRGFRTQVRWGNQLSPAFTLHQGTIQGSGISPELFKLVNNPVLNSVTENHLGAKIGTTCCAVPTCADDTAVLASTQTAEDQLVLDIVINQMNQNRIKINGGKTEVLYYNNSGWHRPTSLKVNNAVLSESCSAVHLGITHSPDPDVNSTRVSDRIKSATKSLYAMFGAGLHGRNGLNPVVCRKLWLSYIMPVLIYGAELWALEDKHIKRLETFQLGKLRQLQNLPDRTANAAVLGLIGLRPVEAELDLRTLGLFRRAVDKTDSIEYQIALRQLAMKTSKSSSWFVYVDSILNKYDLPSAHATILNRGTVSNWKAMTKARVNRYWEDRIKVEANKSTTRYISAASLRLDSPALLWSSSMSSPRETQKGRIKAKALCGVLRLQVHDHIFSGGRQTSKCKLCGSEAEDRRHFLLRCPTLTYIRVPHLEKLIRLLTEPTDREAISDGMLIQLVLDPNHPSCSLTKDASADQLVLAEAINRDMIYRIIINLHHKALVLSW